MESKEIKNYLKEKGIDTRKVSIRHEYPGYSEAFNITIKDINVSASEVEKLAKHFEYYETDERTGEILAGGNTFIYVNYDYDIIKELNEKYNQDVVDIIKKELSKKTEEEVKSWNDGNVNPIITLADKVICYKKGYIIEIRNLETNMILRSDINYLAATLIQMELLNKVLGDVK